MVYRNDIITSADMHDVHIASMQGDLQRLRALLASDNALVERPDEHYGRRPLHWAAANGHFELVLELVDKFNAHIWGTSHWHNDQGSRPVHLAAAFGHQTIVEYFCKLEPKLATCPDWKRYYPIHRAAVSNQQHIVQFFVEILKMNVAIPTEYYRDGLTPLHLAAREGHLDLAKMLVERYGAKLGSKSSWFRRLLPVHLAAFHGQMPILTWMAAQDKSLLEARTVHGFRVIESAALGGQNEVLQHFLDDPSVGRNRKAKLARKLLHLACEAGHLDTVQLMIIKYGANPAAKFNGKHHVDIADKNGHRRVVDYLRALINPKNAAVIKEVDNDSCTNNNYNDESRC